MYKYKYNGKTEVELNNIGMVKPGDEFSSDNPVNHPDCELIEERAVMGAIVEEEEKQTN